MDAQTTSTSTQASVFSSTQQSPSTKIVPPAPKPVKAPSTEAFLKDFTLVAEAAKRAQMAVLMRDLGNVNLS